MSPVANLAIDVQLRVTDLTAALAADVRRGLGAKPKTLPSKWFYDEEGSRLFEAITRLPEYYPTRREQEILERRADEVAEASQAATVVELGSGTSAKTRILLDALERRGTLRRFVPLDVDEATLRAAGRDIALAYPGVAVHAVVGDFERHLDVLPGGERRLVAFLGGTIGNLVPAERARFLSRLAEVLAPGDGLLLGTDLVKDPCRLVAAYDDSQGVTAAFNRNVLAVINRRLEADFVPDRFEHVARWCPEREWMEMWLRSLTRQRVKVARTGTTATFEEGEELRTEVSAKFRRPGVTAELAAAGMEVHECWTDPGQDFALTLAFRRA